MGLKKSFSILHGAYPLLLFIIYGTLSIRNSKSRLEIYHSVFIVVGMCLQYNENLKLFGRWWTKIYVLTYYTEWFIFYQQRFTLQRKKKRNNKNGT